MILLPLLGRCGYWNRGGLTRAGGLGAGRLLEWLVLEMRLKLE